MADDAATSKVVFKKSGRAAQMFARKRTAAEEDAVNKAASSSSDEEDGQMESLVRNRTKRTNPMVQSTSKAKMRKIRHESSSSGDDDGEAAERAKALNIDHSYESSKTTDRVGPSDMGATMLNEIETDFAVDAQAQFERLQQTLKAVKETEKDDKVYRGMALYGAKEKQDSAAGNASNGFVRKGPIRAPQFLRQSVRWDFAPDLCKDYKETGFCTFGDSCKFLHDRTDYKHGWELERDFQQGKLKDEDEHKYEISDDEDDLPFKCYICRESFTHPIVTKCKHYFCEKCALDHYRKSQKCYVCDKNTYGVFNPAKEIIARTTGEGKKNKKTCDHDHDDDDHDHSGDDGASAAPAAEGDKEDTLKEDTAIEMLPDEPPAGADDGDAEQNSDESGSDEKED